MFYDEKPKHDGKKNNSQVGIALREEETLARKITLSQSGQKRHINQEHTNDQMKKTTVENK